MDRYSKWLLRSRIITAIGMLCGVAFVWIDALRQWPYSYVAIIASWLLAFVGALDSLGLIDRRRVREAIEEHNIRQRLNAKKN
jgi:hypothetical protein